MLRLSIKRSARMMHHSFTRLNSSTTPNSKPPAPPSTTNPLNAPPNIHGTTFTLSSAANPATKPSTSTTTADSLKHYTADLNKAYAEIERKMMERIRENSQARFRGFLVGGTLLILWITALFGGRIRKMLSDQTADIARETLENESIKVQTNELATAVVQTILNDKEITANAAKFLREASTAPETQQALLALTLHVLKHTDTLKEVNSLVKNLVAMLTKDDEVRKQLAELLIRALQEQEVKDTLISTVIQLCKDPAILAAATELALALLQQSAVLNATNTLLVESTQNVIGDKQVSFCYLVFTLNINFALPCR